MSNLYQIVVHATRGPDFIFLWQRCNMLCKLISGFVDDVMFAHFEVYATGDASSA